jgi:uncharacterized SAM-binding protein YcdF (DUF218 family)
VGQRRNTFSLAELGPGGLSSLALAFATGLLGAGLPVAWRTRQVLAASALDDRRSADAILVLGRELVDDQPTAVFRARLDHGARLFREGWAPLVIVSGGVTGTARRSEATAGREYLLACGLPADAVSTEDSSRHTLENLVFVRETLRRQGWRRLVLVSDPLHLARAVAFARGLSIEVACSPAQGAPPRRGSLEWWLRAAREGFLLHWYHVGLAYSRLIRSERLLGRVT